MKLLNSELTLPLVVLGYSEEEDFICFLRSAGQLAHCSRVSAFDVGLGFEARRVHATPADTDSTLLQCKGFQYSLDVVWPVGRCLPRDSTGRAKACIKQNSLRTPAAARFMPRAVGAGLQLSALADTERADAFRAVEFVARRGLGIDAQLSDPSWKFAPGQGGIGMESDSVFARDTTDLRKGLN